MLGRNPPEIAYCERASGGWPPMPHPWQPAAVIVVSERLVFKPQAVGDARADRGVNGHPGQG